MSHSSPHQSQLSDRSEVEFSLDHFQVGELGEIASIQADTDLKQRLAALGLRPACTFQILRKASFGGPVHVRVGTTEVIMRLNEAKRILARPS